MTLINHQPQKATPNHWICPTIHSLSLLIYSLFPLLFSSGYLSFYFIHHYIGAYAFENDLHRNSEGLYVLTFKRHKVEWKYEIDMLHLGSIAKKSWQSLIGKEKKKKFLMRLTDKLSLRSYRYFRPSIFTQLILSALTFKNLMSF